MPHHSMRTSKIMIIPESAIATVFIICLSPNVVCLLSYLVLTLASINGAKNAKEIVAKFLQLTFLQVLMMALS
jgi:hypothetical protein